MPSVSRRTATRRCGRCVWKRPPRWSARAAPCPNCTSSTTWAQEHRRPAVVLVSNNPYALDHRIAPRTHLRLDTGELGIVVLDAPGASPGIPGRAWRATQLEVDAAARVDAGIDGEAVELQAPLLFVIRRNR